MITIDIAFDQNEQPWAHQWKHAMHAGMAACGDRPHLRPVRDCLAASRADVTVTWGLRGSRRTLMKHSMDRGARHVIMERGFIGDRKHWTALTFDGLGRRGAAPVIEDPQRFVINFGQLMLPWKVWSPRKRALIMGQVTGDATTAHVNFASWATTVSRALSADGWEVAYRHHPEERDHRRVAPPHVKVLAPMPLPEAFNQTDFVATFNSTAAVNAVLYGIPTYAADEGSPAWEVTSRVLAQTMPERGGWAAQLAWRQWTMEEIYQGAAWHHLRTIAVRDASHHI